MAMSLEDERLVKRLTHMDARVDVSTDVDCYPAFPKGNRRRKPVCWIERGTLQRLVNCDILTRKNGQVSVSKRYQKKFKAREDVGDKAAQHRDMETREIYTPDGVIRKARINRRVSVLRSIARKRLPGGANLLSPAQVEAGEQFAKDYTLSGMGFVTAQDFTRAEVDGGFNPAAQENAIISRMDRRKRVNEATSCLGPGLDRAVIAVCCEDWSLDQLERTENWARHSGVTILKLALDRLAQFYGTVPGE